MWTWTKARSLRGLAFDIENKPGTYGPGDYTHPKVTAIGWQFLDEKTTHSMALTRDYHASMVASSEVFREAWDKADFVVGHNIRRHDKKILDGLYTAIGVPILESKRMVDTYCDQPKMAGLSRSLENLAARWGCPEQKMSMSEHDWERAYDGDTKAVMLMRKRVESDVRISIWLYDELRRRNLL